ncbi:MAG TPA: adenylate/guanylate cyclase domain-containing protein, partial [Candidatus Omnitrophica bacterium]|nr:adenylate/guanylate cyclase domain-containing protein [Candidatus Omnitrophota bacterium]
MRKISLLNPYTVGFSTILLVIVLYFLSIDLIEQLELKTLDLRFKYSQRLVPSNRIVLVTIDNKSEDRIGRWPWGRDKHAKVIDNLSSWGAKVIGMDVIFPQPEENPVFKIFLDRNFKETIPENTVKRLKEEFDTDRILASSIERAGNVVLGYYFYTDPTEGEKATEHLTEEQKERVRKFIFSKAKIVSISQTKEGEKFLLRKGYGVETSIEEISRACKDYGFLNIFPDADGITRNAALAIQYSYRGGEDWYGSFPMQILKNYLGESNIILRVSEYGISPIAIGKKLIPNDTSGAILINYSIRSDSFPTYSFIDVMEGNVNPEEFKDKIVLIGITDPGLLRDSWATPVEIATPGIKIHANVIDTILHSRFISYSGRIELLNLIAVIFFGVILMVFIPRFSHAIYGAYLALFLFIGYRWLGYYMFKTMNVWINLVYPLGSIALVYTTEALYRNITTERKKRQIRSAFQTYVPPQVVNELIRNPEKLTLGGEKKNVSIFFSDIKEFSTISEKLSPEELVELINSYLTPMTEIIFKYEGTLDKYIGDAVVAFFGA